MSIERSTVPRNPARTRFPKGWVAFLMAVHGCGQYYGRLEKDPDNEVLGEERIEDAPSEQARAPVDWCDAEPILSKMCQRCHTDPPEHGAPFSLTDYEDTQRVLLATSDAEYPMYEQMFEAITSELMPPTYFRLEPEVEPLSCRERETLLRWLEASAPARPDGLECHELEARLLECPEDLEDPGS